MQVIKHAPDLYEIPDFLSDTEIDVLNQILSNSTEADWMKIVVNTHGEDDYWFSKVLFCHIPTSITNKVNSLFRSYSRMSGLQGIQRLKVGQDMPVHTDNISNKIIQYGVVIYLNDDFEGGATIYPDLNIAIKPKKNHLVIHNANYVHGAALVETGNTRYILSCFANGTDEEPAILADWIVNT